MQAAANQNKLANEAAYKSWVEGHSVQEIDAANRARRRLRVFHKVIKDGPIKDDRQPKKSATGYLLFAKSKWQSGEFSGSRPGSDTAKTIADEWNSLSAAERQVCVERLLDLRKHVIRLADHRFYVALPGQCSVG